MSQESKNQFDALVEATADEYTGPYDERQRIAQARAQIFDEITRNIIHEFVGLKDQIQALQAEVSALAPKLLYT